MPKTHPILKLAKAQEWSRAEVFEFLEIPPSSARLLVTGHSRAAWRRAAWWAERCRGLEGAFSAVDVMRWQDENERSA